MTDHVSFDMAKKLHDAGVRVESRTAWSCEPSTKKYQLLPVNDRKYRNRCAKEYHNWGIGEEINPPYPAPSIGELLDALPRTIQTTSGTYYLGFIAYSDFCANYFSYNKSGEYDKNLFDHVEADTLPDALAELLLWCVECGHVPAEQTQTCRTG